MSKSPDAIVIGAGIVGTATALALTNAGLKVLVIDRGNIANGTTSAGEGNILVSDKEPGAELKLALHSRDTWFEINDDIGGGFELEAKGGLVVARSESGVSGLNYLANLQRREGIVARSVGTDELRKLEPNLSHSITEGVYYPQDAQCQPMLATARMLRTVLARGGDFLPHANITAITTSQEQVTGVLTSAGTFEAP